MLSSVCAVAFAVAGVVVVQAIRGRGPVVPRILIALAAIATAALGVLDALPQPAGTFGPLSILACLSLIAAVVMSRGGPGRGRD